MTWRGSHGAKRDGDEGWARSAKAMMLGRGEGRKCTLGSFGIAI